MITTALATSAKLGWLTGVHAPTDVYKIALYTSAASLDSTTTAYVSADEITSSGYNIGGEVLSGYSATVDGTAAILTFSNPSWPNASIVAAGALIYNSSKANAAIAIISFGGDAASTNAAFTIQFPAFDAAHALIRFS